MSTFAKKYEVIRSSARKDPIVVSGKNILPKGKDVAILDDPGQAREVEARYGRTGDDDLVRVIPVDNWRKDSHKWSFSVRKNNNETSAERAERLRADGWVEYKPGRWKMPQRESADADHQKDGQVAQKSE